MYPVSRPLGTVSLAVALAATLSCSSEAPPEGGLVGQPTSTAAFSGSAGGNGSAAPGGSGAPTSGSSAGMPGASGSVVAPGTTPTSGSSAAPLDPNEIPATPPATELALTPRVARLSHQQWVNSVQQLLHLSDISDIEGDVSGDALINFDTEADALFVTEQLRRDLERASERLADRVVGDATAFALLEGATPPSDPSARERAFVTQFGLRAFRRPLTEDEITTHLALFDEASTLYPELDEFTGGASLVIQAMLQSPHFLYRTELGAGDGTGAPVALNDFEVASKLAFALTNTMPSDELLAAAAAGELQDRAKIALFAGQLLDGENGVDGISNFNAQVLRLGAYDGIHRDPQEFPDFSPNAPAAMRQEVLHFLEWAFKSGHGVKDYYTSPVGFVNSDLAPLYGLTGNYSADTFTQVELDPTQRAGLLTQPGFLSSYISDSEPDIIHRGVFIATRLLCIILPPPDPKATKLIDLQPDMTNRERVETTTGKGTCGENCHSALLNPLGYAFENYDAIGKYRTTDQGLPVDAASSYTLDGKMQSFTNGVELSHLLSESKQVHSCYVRNMMQYLHGRPLVSEDAAFADYYARLSRADMLSVRDMAIQIATSDAFLTRLP